MHDFTGSTTEPIKEIMREIVDMGEKNKKEGGEWFQDTDLAEIREILDSTPEELTEDEPFQTSGR